MTARRVRRYEFRREPEILEDRVTRIRRSCGGPTDGTSLRLMLAIALLEVNRKEDALAELRWSLRFDPENVAALRMLGLVLVKMGGVSTAVEAFQDGIEIAVERGNMAAAREMKVFLRRLKR